MDASRPSALRLAGFLCVAAGGLLLGIGSVMNWAVIGLVGSTALDSPIKGTDVWEGRATLGQAYARKNDTANAIKSYEKAVELDPNNQIAKRQLEQLKGSK